MYYIHRISESHPYEIIQYEKLSDRFIRQYLINPAMTLGREDYAKLWVSFLNQEIDRERLDFEITKIQIADIESRINKKLTCNQLRDWYGDNPHFAKKGTRN